jgi:hypothetical protein
MATFSGRVGRANKRDYGWARQLTDPLGRKPLRLPRGLVEYKPELLMNRSGFVIAWIRKMRSSYLTRNIAQISRVAICQAADD